MKPISRKFWSYLRYLPQSIRVQLIRTQFEVDYDLPKELVFKQAETPDEITQALNIVYDSYRELNYIEANEARLRVTKYHAIPTTVILIAKWDNEVVGTISIIPDSAMGIPSEQTWNLDKYKSSGQQIAEISSLAIKKGFRRKRGKLLFPLCKIMIIYCIRYFKLDGIIASTTLEVEAFYTDILLFEKVVAQTGQRNSLVKYNPSTCCYLPLNETTINNYKKIYGHKNKKFNLYHFFIKEITTNIQLPEVKHCLQAYMIKQNVSLSEILKNHPTLTEKFSEKDKIVLKNIDVTEAFSYNLHESNPAHNRNHKRYQTKQEAWLFNAKKKTSVPAYITDVSQLGFKIILSEKTNEIEKNDEVLLYFQYENKIIHLTTKIHWVKNNCIFGCRITTSNDEWTQYYEMISRELSLTDNVLPFKVKKIA